MSRSRFRVPASLCTAARKARKSGWVLTRTGSGHIRWRGPDGAIVITSSTPGGGNRSIRNSRAQLKRAGLNEERT
jgi:hypothetical protein